VLVERVASASRLTHLPASLGWGVICAVIPGRTVPRKRKLAGRGDGVSVAPGAHSTARGCSIWAKFAPVNLPAVRHTYVDPLGASPLERGRISNGCPPGRHVA